jgi:hypothetical protein
MAKSGIRLAGPTGSFYVPKRVAQWYAYETIASQRGGPKQCQSSRKAQSGAPARRRTDRNSDAVPAVAHEPGVANHCRRPPPASDSLSTQPHGHR